MNQFVNGMKYMSSEKLTENGAKAFASTGNALVDMFGTIGAMRGRPEQDILKKFSAAFAENKLLATRMAFYARDIRGGLGERQIFRTILKNLAENHPEIVNKNMHLIAEYGRWDDYFTLIGTACEREMFFFLSVQLVQDLENMSASKSISLLAKWLKSETASAKESKEIALKTMRAFCMSAREYRKVLSALRNYLKVTEGIMSRRAWNELDYEKIPSLAMHKYRKSFYKNDLDRYTSYLNSLVKEEAVVNAATLYPYDIIEKFMYTRCSVQEKQLFEAQWKALPNYVGEGVNAVVMADVSGSMSGRPMATSIGLAIYFAERNKGAFSNMYMTFTDKPHFITIDPKKSIAQKVKQVEDTDVGYSTNLEKGFMAILDVAVKTKCPQEDLPKSLIVISDMEIDCFRSPSRWGFLDTMRKRFAAAGYKMPAVVMWNVNARNDTFHAPAIDPDVQFISGSSVSAFKSIVGGIGKTAYELMEMTLNDPRYAQVTV